LEEAFKRGFFNDVEDATARAARRRNLGTLLEAVGDASSGGTDAAKALQEELGELAKLQKSEAAE
jgi:DNA sulfur modification protein DndC